MKKALIYSGAILAFFSAVVFAQSVPQLINYQGRLTDNTGLPINGVREMRVRLLDADTLGATVLWSETQSSVPVNKGIYNLILGSVKPLPPSALSAASRFLEVRVAGEILRPRSRLTSVPYAHQAASVPDSAIGSLQILDGSIASGDVGFNYAGSSSQGGPASGLTCTDCLNATQIQDIFLANTSDTLVGDLWVTGSYLDSLGYAGDVGQVLSATGSGTDWINPPAAGDSDWTINGNDMYSAVSGNVGIGKPTPGTKLDVNGAVSASGLGTSGSLGNGTYGAYGQYGTGNYGYIGGVKYGMYAYLASVALGDYAVYGYGVHTASANGVGYGIGSTLGGVQGYNYWGNPYTFGVAGYSYLDYNRSGGVIGADYSGNYFGALGYKNSSGSVYGGYFTSYTSGSGFASLGEGETEPVDSGIGIGVYGQQMGAHITGEEYGLHVAGNRYALYTSGDSYTTGVNAILNDTGAGDRVATYCASSLSPDIYTYGMGTLVGGQAIVGFDSNFLSLVSIDTPIVVTTTAIGADAQIYITDISAVQFSVASESPKAMEGNVNFTWIAIGKRKGYENHHVPKELLSSTYDQEMQQVTHNEADTSKDAKGMYFTEGNLHFGALPKTSLDSKK